MDRKLVAWARMVKTRSRRRRAGMQGPSLWFFTDHRLDDPFASIRALAGVRPPGLIGIVLRGDHRALGPALARFCRARRLPLLIAGDVRLAHALGAGLHLPSAGRPLVRLPTLLSASVHDRPQSGRARRTGVRLVFVSPVFPTASHPGATSLGPHRAARLVRGLPADIRVLALGGIDGITVRRLPVRFTGAGAIGALA
jgi:thiamine-phosphate pyrophosphorylase